MIKSTAILLAMTTLFSQSVIARGGPANIGNPAGMGQAPTSIPAMNDASLNHPDLDTQLNANTAAIALDKRGFDQPQDNAGLQFTQTTPATAMPLDPIDLPLNATDDRNQTHAGAEQRGFSNPLMNPGLSGTASTNNLEAEAANPAANDRRDNNQRVMERFSNLTEEETIPTGIVTRQASLGYDTDTLSSPTTQLRDSTRQSTRSQDGKTYDPFAETASGKAKDKAKKKKDATKEENKEETEE